VAKLTQYRMNLVEWSQFFHKGKVLPQVALLAQENQVLMDIPWMVCNDGTTHVYSVDTKLPTVAKTAYNEGTEPSKGQKAQEREFCTMLTGLSSVAADLCEVGGQEGALRAKQDIGFAEALKQAAAQMIFYGNRTADDRDINGFATRYNALTGTKASNVFSCTGGAGAVNTSVYLVNWGPDVYCTFPEGTTGGYTKVDRGTVPFQNGTKRLYVKETEHRWQMGLVVEDWRSVARICNIVATDAAALTGEQAPTSFTNVLHQMLRAKGRMRKPGKKVFYVNELMHTTMMRLALTMTVSTGLTVQKAATQFGDANGEMMELSYMGTPVRLCDRILNTEQQVA